MEFGMFEIQSGRAFIGFVILAGEAVGAAAVHAYLLDGFDADDLCGGVVATVDFDGAGYEVAGGFLDVFALRDDGGEVALGHFIVEAVGAKDEDVVGLEGDGGGVGGDEHFRAEGADEDVAGIGAGHFAGGDEAEFALLVDPGVVLSDLLGFAVADEVTAGVADVGDDGLVVADGAGDDGGGHFLTAILRGQGAIVDGGVGVLNEAGEQADEHGAGLSFGEFVGDDGDGSGRGDFSEVEAAYAVCHDEEVSVGAGLLARGRDEGAHGIFIIGTNFSEIACLTELYIEHWLRLRMVRKSPERCSIYCKKDAYDLPRGFRTLLFGEALIRPGYGPDAVR